MDFINSNDSKSPHPLGLLGGGEHFADVGGGHTEQLRLSRHRVTRSTQLLIYSSESFVFLSLL